ncbi:membrane protein insertion efficiency factor YidD [Teredinibacter sp. KSP-S5-2]|uniref:membrane protein insertion efficiency factor YidD n=1 Tax=Teredinibacter sp. KSP-S5-2 TaxID=3034506 RepID=UPI0029340FB6|nr:membrane protein insertion efficiency factor YidD [Teredinibacter sp. KSP-S5-2]WNO09129.1 membrane protein insertion efficiency factor YidD [Teredinibacter sp. KSP-S5-2]
METCCQTSRREQKERTKLTALPFLLVIRFYRFWLSPWLGNQCRFEPTCSRYAEQAIQQRGVIIGLTLSIIRILKCNPWHKGGYDPVPMPKNKQQS